ncbi:hypothetical protein [Asanoa siamensis]|uniref:Uncharacterized protein n=1 Tax=Asanoa siamensis TaxID=926357 RepID=A0ABQ4CKT2_9ACTN|nr:hypothetical protein [Asanoa siamensis]GIF71899.1 hypothetical protein Asi02nite_14170 [Asanoa siamensis]
MTQDKDTRPEASRPGVNETLLAEFRRYAVALAANDTWVPWAEFAEKVWLYLAPRRKAHDTAKCARCQVHTNWVAAISEQFHERRRVYDEEWRNVTARSVAKYGDHPLSFGQRALLSREVDAATRERVPDPTPPALLDAASRHVAREQEYDQDGRRRIDDSLGAWRQVRGFVLSQLFELGLTGTVVRTDCDRHLAEHEADLSGLVRLHTADGPPESSLPSWAWHGRDTHAKHALRMMANYGLMPANVPTGLRGFCGQHTAKPDSPVWMDHVNGWLDEEELPVLTVEPYGHTDNPLLLAAEIAAYIEEQALPLVVDEPRPGLWNDSTTLVILRYDPEAPVITAERRVYSPLTQRMESA